MSETKRWREVDLETRPAWRAIFNADWSSAEIEGRCPVCAVSALHRWYVLDSMDPANLRGRAFLGHGRLWEWCSNCYTYEYYPDGYVPDWWIAPYSVEMGILRYDPEPIEKARAGQHG